MLLWRHDAVRWHFGHDSASCRGGCVVAAPAMPAARSSRNTVAASATRPRATRGDGEILSGDHRRLVLARRPEPQRHVCKAASSGVEVAARFGRDGKKRVIAYDVKRAIEFHVSRAYIPQQGFGLVDAADADKRIREISEGVRATWAVRGIGSGRDPSELVCRCRVVAAVEMDDAAHRSHVAAPHRLTEFEDGIAAGEECERLTRFPDITGSADRRIGKPDDRVFQFAVVTPFDRGRRAGERCARSISLAPFPVNGAAVFPCLELELSHAARAHRETFRDDRRDVDVIKREVEIAVPHRDCSSANRRTTAGRRYWSPIAALGRSAEGTLRSDATRRSTS